MRVPETTPFNFPPKKRQRPSHVASSLASAAALQQRGIFASDQMGSCQNPPRRSRKFLLFLSRGLKRSPENSERVHGVRKTRLPAGWLGWGLLAPLAQGGFKTKIPGTWREGAVGSINGCRVPRNHQTDTDHSTGCACTWEIRT